MGGRRARHRRTKTNPDGQPWAKSGAGEQPRGPKQRGATRAHHCGVASSWPAVAAMLLLLLFLGAVSVFVVCVVVATAADVVVVAALLLMLLLLHCDYYDYDYYDYYGLRQN